MNAIEIIKEILDKSGAEYTEHGNGFDIEDVGGSISVLDDKVYFVYGNTEPGISIDHPQLVDWVNAYVDNNEAFGAIIEKTEHVKAVDKE